MENDVSKRNKKYNPNKLAQRISSSAHTVHTLEMSFCIDEVNAHVDKWKELNNASESDSAPESVVYEVYHGDLIICLKNLLIPLDQEWFLGVDCHLFNYETEEVFTIPVQFETPLMSFNEFRFGSDSVKINRGGGIKTRWKGIMIELNDIIESDAPSGFELIKSNALLRVETKFNNVQDYIYFKQIKNMRSLGV